MPELGRIEVQEVPLREPGPREVRVRVRAVGVCGSDTAYYRIGRIGDWIVDVPIILGHEAAGEVVAVGEAVTRVQVGDRVAIEPGTPCRDCADCHAGDYHLCPGLTFLSRDAEAWSTSLAAMPRPGPRSAGRPGVDGHARRRHRASEVPRGGPAGMIRAGRGPPHRG
ncbi:alcohol dehydrogenase catalytic domain-containing protein [Microbacterium aureliae]